MTYQVLGQIAQDFLEERGIWADTAARVGVYTAKRAGHETVPSATGDVIAFPYYDHNVISGVKYRTLDKKFWQEIGGRTILYGADALDDPGLETGYLPLIITEGEIDALTAIQCGFPLTVSVPDGAPPATGELQPLNVIADAEGKFKYLWNDRDRLARVKRFVLAVDNDPPGLRLAEELMRRLGPGRCSFPVYPPDCKDLNDVLMKHGPEDVSIALNAAQPYPIRGVYHLSDYPEPPKVQTFSTGWWTLDRNVQVFPGEFMVVTGIPGHGKSSFVINLMVNLARSHGWRAAMFSPEMPPVPFVQNKMRALVGQDRSVTDPFLDDRFVFIDSDPTSAQDEDFTLQWVLDRATDAVHRDGIRLLVIDPWNELEHARRPGESMTDYIGSCIRTLKRWARLYRCAVIVVAHPTKEVGKGGDQRTPTLYDIEGSAHWFNKCDHGLIVERAETGAEATIHVAKVRFSETGERGSVRMKYDQQTCRFTTLQEDGQ
jgi:twinkle protein